MPTHPSSGIWVIALVTALSMRAVTENRAPPRRAAAITSWTWYALSARIVISPVAPARFTVARASATSWDAPLGEYVEPLRRRVAAISGADSGVEMIAKSALSPLTLEYPYPAPCFWYP